MSGTEREDYLMRQIKILAAMLARILGLRAAGQVEEARAELEQSYGLLLGPRAELLRRVDAGTAAMLLGSPEEILMLSRLVDEEAEQEKDGERAALLKARAADLRAEAGRLHPDQERP